MNTPEPTETPYKALITGIDDRNPEQTEDALEAILKAKAAAEMLERDRERARQKLELMFFLPLL